MRFQHQVGVIQRNNRHQHHLNGRNSSSESRRVNGTLYYSASENESNGNNFDSDDKCLKTLNSIIHESDSERINNFDSRDVDQIERLLKFKTNPCGYFKNFIDTRQQQREDINIDLNGNDNDNVLLIETLNLTEDNLSRVSKVIFFLF